MNALLTGGAGFIGSHLLQLLLAEGSALTVLDIAPKDFAWRLEPGPYRYIQGDIRDADVVTEAMRGCDTVFHLAGVLGTDALVERPEDAVTTNVLGTLNVLQAARRSGALVVNVSLIPDWPNSYMISKQAASMFCRMFSHEFLSKVTDLRFTHVYGPRQTWTPIRKVIPSFLRAALVGNPIEIYGDGSQLLDLLHVSDAVRAISIAAKTRGALGQSIEIGTGSVHTLAAIAEMIIEQTNSRAGAQFVGRRPGEAEDRTQFRAADIRSQTEVLAFSPKINLCAGLAETARWVENHLLEGAAQ
jgi:UDP-glucose 4-epimerase